MGTMGPLASRRTACDVLLGEVTRSRSAVDGPDPVDHDLKARTRNEMGCRCLSSRLNAAAGPVTVSR